MLVWTSICLLCISAVIAQENPCVEHDDCRECVGSSPLCSWCADPSYGEQNKPRCDLTTNHKSKQGGCSAELLQNPEGGKDIKPEGNQLVSDAQGKRGAIQIMPQQAKLNLRMNEPQKLDMMFRLAKDYPVDLYYLMDLSWSMNDDKANVATLGTDIANELKKLTRDVQLGFGSFVDKTVSPFVRMYADPEEPTNSCPAETGGIKCGNPYGFKHQLTLTDNIDRFKETVEEASVSGNLDNPEGGFDALMQAVVCREGLGWRNNSRKLLILSTDAPFHQAGDGKLAGIVQPNDGNCYLENGLYYKSNEMDYPSVSHIARKVSESKMNVIFAVTEDQLAVYGSLTDHITGSLHGALNNDSSNIVALIADNYRKINSRVQMEARRADGDKLDDGVVKFNFRSKCTGTEVTDTNKCLGLPVGNNVTFEVTVEATKCPENGDFERTYIISPVDLNDKLVVKVNLECSCGCEDDKKEKNAQCEGKGDLVCGICECTDPSFYGEFCQCSTNETLSDDWDAPCKNGSGPICSGRGRCECGQCKCFERHFTGKFCECDTQACLNFNNLVCGGNGKCKCDGQCDCDPMWSGPACSCYEGNDTCISQHNNPDNLVCSGPKRGECVCGKCVCKDPYIGFCSDCPTCPGRCDLENGCVLCRAWDKGSKGDKCDSECSHVKVVSDIPNDPGLRKCDSFVDDEGCSYEFVYRYLTLAERDDTDSEVVAYVDPDQRKCPKEVNVIAIVLGIIAGIILIGLLILIIWKVCDHFAAKREIARLENEKPKWTTQENETYIPPVQTTKNPAFDPDALKN